MIRDGVDGAAGEKCMMKMLQELVASLDTQVFSVPRAMSHGWARRGWIAIHG